MSKVEELTNEEIEVIIFSMDNWERNSDFYSNKHENLFYNAKKKLQELYKECKMIKN